jgi:Prenyltransferase and squalene oxidase repeat
MDNAFAAADRFMLSQARLLERRQFATIFLGQPAARVVDALRGYQNDDGGFGQAMEPDTRCPASLPIYVEVAFQALAAAAGAGHGPASDGAAEFGAAYAGMVERACDFLARTANDAAAGGAVPAAFPIIELFPRAAHWTEWTYQPGLNPTAGLVGLLYKLGVDHPWRAEGAAYCWRQLDSGELPGDAHALSETLIFLEHVPDRDRADEHAAVLAATLADLPMFHLDPDATGYGLSPLHLAPKPGSRWRKLFTDSQIDGHLDRLQSEQQPDGGWPISWEPPSEAAVWEWRGMVTLQALRTLTSYGRLSPPA